MKELQKKNPNYHLLVPGYDNCFECEIQLGLSGSVKFGETPDSCLQREIEEELGVTIKGEDIFTLPEGDSIHIPIDTIHGLENKTNEQLEIIEVQSGTYLGEDDIVRFEDIYDRVKS